MREPDGVRSLEGEQGERGVRRDGSEESSDDEICLRHVFSSASHNINATLSLSTARSARRPCLFPRLAPLAQMANVPVPVFYHISIPGHDVVEEGGEEGLGEIPESDWAMDKLAGMVNRVVRELGEKNGKGGMDQEKEQKGQAKDTTLDPTLDPTLGPTDPTLGATLAPTPSAVRFSRHYYLLTLSTVARFARHRQGSREGTFSWGRGRGPTSLRGRRARRSR